MVDMTLSRRSLLTGLLIAAAGAGLSRHAGAARPTITVYKDPT